MLYHLNRLVLPLIVSNIVHMIAIKKGWLPGLARPVSVRLFGANKTWRGFILLPLLNGLALPLFSHDAPFPESFALGAALGLAYMIFELPNSYVKRHIGIAPGGEASQHRYLFMLMDKTDSSLGVSLAYYLITGIGILEACALFVIGSAAHILFSLLLVSLRIKRSF